MLWARAIFSSVADQALQCSSTLSHKRYDFRKRCWFQNVCLDFLWIFLKISHPMKNWARYYQKCILVFLPSTWYSCPLLINLEFPRQIFVKYTNTNFMTLRSVKTDLFHAERQRDRQRDGWTEMTKLIRVVASHDKRIPASTEWRILKLRRGERSPIWRVAGNVLNNQ